LAGVGNVGGSAERPAAEIAREAGGGGLRLGPVTAGEHHVGAGGGEGGRHREPEAARTARDESRTTAEIKEPDAR
jgi:hypothetical protein